MLRGVMSPDSQPGGHVKPASMRRLRSLVVALGALGAGLAAAEEPSPALLARLAESDERLAAVLANGSLLARSVVEELSSDGKVTGRRDVLTRITRKDGK